MLTLVDIPVHTSNQHLLSGNSAYVYIGNVCMLVKYIQNCFSNLTKDDGIKREQSCKFAER